jgi:cytochrome c oxidase subunit 3
LSNPASLMIREQFRTAEQQREASSVGMWIFIVTEVMLFSGLFLAFTVYRTMYPTAFIEGSGDMSIALGATNTVVLICSSLTMAFAVYSGATGNQRGLALSLIGTMFLGFVFLAIKFSEYYLHYTHHKVPGFWWEWPGTESPHVEMFFVFYFIMTALHALHMFVGEGLLFTLLLRTGAGSFSSRYYTPVELTGLYWHFVDIVWVFLFAIFYIEGLHVHGR